MNEVPKVNVGIMSEPEIEFTLNGEYISDNIKISGVHKAAFSNGKVLCNDKEADTVVFVPVDAEKCSFTLHDVTIGVNFHWQRKENQTFRGALKLIVEGKKVTAINTLSVEKYLESVISSEMSATASLELLKAHAVISRSWLLSQLHDEHSEDGNGSLSAPSACVTSADEQICWYDRDNHVNFDVCADDHCQRYQGITRESTENVCQAVKETWGQVVAYNGEICDARFSKCCGGAFEQFENCWEPTHHPYLDVRLDGPDEDNYPDLTDEKNAEKWILSSPKAFCNTSDNKILSQVLNNYDQETTDFYRWKVEYTQEQISKLIRERSGIDFGEILDLEPVARGTSGRLYKLRFVGSKRTLVIGKELEIRRILSPSHLYSSAFVVEKVGDVHGVPQKFILHGAGWGHGVGLCQIGAAVMGEKGYNYQSILLHYFINASIDKLY
jgi:stage II sporulation protein D